jgi:hypothetical protein
MTVDEIECIEEGGTEPTIALPRRLAAALDADVRLTPGHDLGSVWFEPPQPDLISTAVSGQKRQPSHTATHRGIEAFNMMRAQDWWSTHADRGRSEGS